MNGNKDAYLLEGSDLSKYDAAKQAWVVQGDIIELSGKTQNCAWDTEHQRLPAEQARRHW